MEKIYIRILLDVVGKYAGSVIGDSVITRDDIMEETKTVPTKVFLTK